MFNLKNIQQSLLLTIFFSLAFISCERNYEIDTSQYQNELVLNSFFTVDSTISIKLSISNSPYSNNSNQSVRLANVTLFASDGSYYTMDYLNNGIFLSNIYPKIGLTYKLVGSLSDYGKIESTSYVPKKLHVKSFEKKNIINQDGEKNLELEIEFEKDSNKYVVIRHIVEKTVVSLNKDTIGYRDTVLIQGLSESFESILPDYSVHKIILAKIGDFSSLKFLSYDGFKKYDNLIKGISKFEIYSCSKDYYEYQKDLQLYNWNNANVNSSIINSNGLYSNISNGLGIFAGFNKIIVTDTFK